MADIELDRVTVRKGDAEVLRGVDLFAETGRVLGIVGASGSGKTTVLRAIAGLDRVSDGSVLFDGSDVTNTEPGDRNVAFVFQNPALYPKRTVARNISFPLEMRHDPADEIRRRVDAEARAHHIMTLLAMSPRQLSAGEAQVVQIARAMVRSPSVLLLDEPFAHLDLQRAARLRRELSVIQQGFGATTVLATNNSIDVMSLADQVAVIERGKITQVGPPLEVYERPCTAAAALMTGDADVIEVRVETDHVASWLEHPGFRLRAWQPGLRAHRGRRLQMVVRPEWWQLDDHGPVSATVERVTRLGTATSLWCRVGGHPLTLTLAGSAPGTLHPGDTISLRLDRSVLLDPIDGYQLEL